MASKSSFRLRLNETTSFLQSEAGVVRWNLQLRARATFSLILVPAWLIARAGGRAFSIKSPAWRIHETQFIDILELMMANRGCVRFENGTSSKKM
jgi:hypothetical protein